MGYAERKSFKQIILAIPSMVLGAFLASFALEVFLIPNRIIDGGVVGVSILISNIFGSKFFYPGVLLLNIPFIFLAYRHIAKALVIQMIIALTAFAIIGHWIGSSELSFFAPYQGDLLEIVVIGGLLLGLGGGLIIRSGGCLDGTEILGLIINKKYGLTVGNVILGVNLFIFTIAGIVYQEWHAPVQSLITFFIVVKIMDMVIMGFDEIKSIMVFSMKSHEIGDRIMHELGLGLTVIHGKGGFSGEKREILYLMAERLQLAEIKNIVYAADPNAFIAIGNLHEVTSGRMNNLTHKVKKS